VINVVLHCRLVLPIDARFFPLFGSATQPVIPIYIPISRYALSSFSVPVKQCTTPFKRNEDQLLWFSVNSTH